MSIEEDRLLSLIEFAQQSARLRGKPASNVGSHGHFALYEHELQGLPGITINANSLNREDEIWLAVTRLHETRPPDVSSAMLRPWVKLTQAPTEEPQLRDIVDGASLIEAGTHCSSSEAAWDGRPSIDPQAKITFSEYENASLVTAEFATYVSTKWRPWANEEKLCRKTIRLYAQLFTLKHEFEGSIVETQLELVWGVGLGIWNCNGTTVNYPVLSQLVELSLNPVTGDVEIRPRDVEPRLEVDWYSSVDNLGVADLEKAAKEFFGNATTTFSPFDRGTFEPLLRTAVTNLDANGVYWPSVVPAEDRTTPKPDAKLKVTDTWVLFARPRTNNLFLQDLENLKKQAEELGSYPPAVAAIVTDPETNNPVIELPSYRGVSASYHSEQRDSGNKAQDLFFPKPFNDEQVRIIQLLDCSDGVVAQGPPGTGKTHTIANVICHYLAQGKRVLVTSMKDPALAVLQEQLPEEIRPLAISLLTSEQDGMKQFEHAIYKIASEVQGLDRPNIKRAISHLEDTIDALHGKLAAIDRKISEWAKRNLVKIDIDGEEIDPQDAAREVVQNAGQFEWIPDSLGISPEFAPKFSDIEIVQLREARRALGQDIDYLDSSLPQLIEFPDSKNLLEIHQDLSQLQKLTEAIENGDLPAIANSTAEIIARAQKLLTDIEAFQRLHDTVERANRPWTAMFRDRLRTTGVDNLLTMLQALGAELEKALDWHSSFRERPVFAPEGIELDPEIRKAVRNLAASKSAFGPIGWFGKAAQKAQLANIRILTSPPAHADDWKHVDNYLELLMRLRELSLRWNILARELNLEAPVRDNHPEGGLAAAGEYALCRTVNTLVNAEQEIFSAALHVLPAWNPGREVDVATRVAELEKILRHHISKHRLANVWAAKERFIKALDGRKGRTIDDIRRFILEVLGNPEIEDARLQSEWSAFMGELSRVLGLGIHLATVRNVCEKIEASGAPQYATLLKQPPEGRIDTLLPDNWRSAWRLRRLSTHLASIDAQHELKRLAKERHEVESDLSRAYRDIVVKRTWLKLAENASPSIRSALQAYLVAIQKIGKGTGKRAVRYRQDARLAAAQANPAVPCWIMPHYRVSESLPPKLGCFDLVVIDEASQSDLSALPALLRAQKVLVVGDDKQVSPEGVGLEEDKIRSLMNRFLDNQVETYRPQMSPERSIYDLYKVVFAKSSVMLKEHFRCVAPIIEYSKREFYNHELRPLRLPKASQRLDPPLVDVFVRDGYRKGDLNLPEARFIVDEIKGIVSDPHMTNRSIGVVSLLADKQALEIWERLTDEIGPELMQRHRIACGDARTFQGKERDIMFLSMVSAPNDRGASLSRDTFAQRFNVAASRARDRMYLVRSVELEDLSTADKLRRSLIQHFATPFAQDEARVEDLRKLCESSFERELYDELTQRGYWVTPQVRIGQYRIDLVVEGHNDARLAVECDGDKYHGPEKWADDMQRQRVLERAGWIFWRCFASTLIRRRGEVLDDLVKALTELGIEPIGAESAPMSIHTERRLVSSESVYGNSKPADGNGNGQSVSTASPLLFNSAGQEASLPGELASPRSVNTASLQGQGHVIGSPVTSGALGKNSDYPLPLGNEPPRTNNSPDTERLNREYGQTPSADRRLAENRSTTNRVIEGLAALEDQFRNPHCSQCDSVAHIRVYTAGPVVVCTNSKCNKIEQIDLQKLQRLVENLRLTCRNCKKVSLMGTKGPLGNYLRCQNCGENTSWQFVAGYSKNNYQ
jgi:very-short-patch-repair endonuclease